MIPARIVKFIEQYANQALAGARDASLAPRGFRISAWHVHPDQQTLTVWIPDPLSSLLVECLLDNGQIAMTIGENVTHETYQLKGRYLRHRPVEADDLTRVMRVRERFGKSIRTELPPGISPDAIARVAVPDPVVAVDVEVHEVFAQTPGPGAGTRIHPPEA
jgi:hypothetical protein